MTKEEYININYDNHLHYWSNIALGFGSIVIISLSLLDYLVTPPNFNTFLVYRIFTASSFYCLFLFNKKSISRNIHYITLILAAMIVSSMVALMISKFGGHQSPYFAGIILVMIFGIGLVPFTVSISIIVSLIIYATYLIPIMSYDTISNKPFFINANIFIIVSTFSILTLRYLSHKRLIKEFGLQYDLDQQKEQLETYSTKLEDLVDERTKNLKESESKLRESESKLRSLFEHATDGIMILDRDGKILDANKEACEIHGFDKDALVGANIELLDTNKNKSLFKERIERILNGESLLFEAQHYRKDGSKVSLEVTANAIETDGNVLIQSFLRDITEKKKLQEQLLQSQKLESIGALAGGVAHNFNNILTAILGNAELLQEHSDIDNIFKKRVNSIESSAKKAGMLVAKLLSFARRDIYEIIPLNLNDIINETLLFEGVLGKKIRINADLQDNISTIEGDRNQLEQVIMNLVVNARDAMPDGGLIAIKTSEINAEDQHDFPAYIPPGRYVLLTISDTGCGIPKEITIRIFEPFFTTKERGKGTGLGLATVYGIIKEHKGHITVKSEAGKGTTFEVYLPVSGKPINAPVTPRLFSLNGHENILVVDDEEDVLDYIKDILENHGYKVMSTNNPLFAIDIFKELSGEIELVITDNIMPLMEGKELIKNLKAIKPDIRIVAVSGYSDDGIPKDKAMIDAFIKKPFEGSHLLSTVRRVLDTGIRNLPPY
jgi:two-component system cell cycle sensor histidine kinase/response regulator CckA